MTRSQKEAVMRMRSNGLGYTEIARLLGLSVNTLKSFGRRYDVPSPDILPRKDSHSISDCKQCGAALTQTPKHRQKSFCSDRCRYAWWEQNRALAKNAKPTLCLSCGKPFFSRKPRKYCNHNCYVAARFGGQYYEHGTGKPGIRNQLGVRAV